MIGARMSKGESLACSHSSACGARLRTMLRSLHARQVFPPDLRDELFGEYSMRLYGAPGRTSLSTLRVIWPALLGPAARAALNGTVLCSIPDLAAYPSWRDGTRLLLATQARLAHLAYPFLPMTNFFINTEAILVHQPHSDAWGPPSNSWVEISHCFFASWSEGIHHGACDWPVGRTTAGTQ